MTKDNKPEPAEPHKQATVNGVGAELSAEALLNLTGWFDVLIQMDLAQKNSNEIRSEDYENADL